MIILPNFFERYTASLRILTSLLILKNGLNIKYLKNLSKIYTAEALYDTNFIKPLNIEQFCLNTFCAVSIIKLKNEKQFKFEIISKGNFFINPKIFTVLILNLALYCEELKIYTTNSLIEINFKGNYKKSLSALKRLQGFYFYSVKEDKGKIIIPTEITAEKSVKIIGTRENIYDQYSPVNLFFGNLV